MLPELEIKIETSMNCRIGEIAIVAFVFVLQWF
jgi:hypothetical protein